MRNNNNNHVSIAFRREGNFTWCCLAFRNDGKKIRYKDPAILEVQVSLVH